MSNEPQKNKLRKGGRSGGSKPTVRDLVVYSLRISKGAGQVRKRERKGQNKKVPGAGRTSKDLDPAPRR